MAQNQRCAGLGCHLQIGQRIRLKAGICVRRVCRSFSMRSGDGVFWSSDQEPVCVLEAVLRPEHFISLIEFTSDQSDSYK